MRTRSLVPSEHARSRTIVALATSILALVLMAASGAYGAPRPKPPPAPSGYHIGVADRGWHDRDLPVFKALGAQVIRSGVADDAAIADYYANGIRTMAVGDYAGDPATWDISSLVDKAKKFGPNGTVRPGAVLNVELGNEQSYSYKSPTAAKAQAYGRKIRELYDALRGTGVGIIAQGDDGNTGSSMWIDNMYIGLPSAHNYLVGWSVHTYQPNYVARLDRVAGFLSRRGSPSSKPFFVTEVGLATDNGTCLSNNYGYNPCMTYDEAAAIAHEKLTYYKGRTSFPVNSVFWFQAFDQRPSGSTEREYYFGIYKADGVSAPKGAFTAELQRSIMANP